MQKTYIRGVRVTPQQADIYGLIKRFGKTGLTDHALVGVATHEMPRRYSESSIRSRRCELTRKGLLSSKSQRIRTSSGRSAAVWVAV